MGRNGRKKIRGCPPTKATLLSKLGTKSGYLLKQKDDSNVWKRHYCVIKPSTFLFYYESEHDSYPLGVVDLEYFTKIEPEGHHTDPEEYAIGEYGFQVKPIDDKRKSMSLHTLRFDVEERGDEGLNEMEDWVEALRDDRFQQVVKQRDGIHDLQVETSERLRKAEKSALHYQRKMADMNKRAKEVVREGMELLVSIKKLTAEPIDDEDKFEDIERHLDLVSSIERMRSLVQDVLERVVMIAGKKNIPTADQQSYLVKNLELQISSLLKESDEQKKLADRLAQLEDQVLVERKKSIDGSKSSSSSTSSSLSSRGAGMKKAIEQSISKPRSFTNAVSAVRNRFGRKNSIKRDSDSDSEDALPTGWVKKESRRRPGTFYYANLDTGEISVKPPAGSGRKSREEESSDPLKKALAKTGRQVSAPVKATAPDIESKARNPVQPISKNTEFMNALAKMRGEVTQPVTVKPAKPTTSETEVGRTIAQAKDFSEAIAQMRSRVDAAEGGGGGAPKKFDKNELMSAMAAMRNRVEKKTQFMQQVDEDPSAVLEVVDETSMKLPDGWSKKESRRRAGTYYYVHLETGEISAKFPTHNPKSAPEDDGQDSPADSVDSYATSDGDGARPSKDY